MSVADLSLGQSTFGAILGRLTDPSGAPVSGAQVKAANRDTNVTVTASTNENGNYEVSYLLPGTYRLTVEHTGFKRYVQQEVRLRVSDRVAVDLQLDVPFSKPPPPLSVE